MTSISKSQIDKLGERLRKAGSLTEEDLRLLQELRAEHDDAMAAVTIALREIQHGGRNLAPTSRLKTTGTIVEKLKRETIRLTQMQDIAGARIVVDGSRLAQSEVVNAITQRFPDCRVIDRRAVPSFGYRAVHVLVPHGRCVVEVQVRTVLQDRWAQMFESLGDALGRQIRYGGPPIEPHKVDPGSELSRAELVAVITSLSDMIDNAEESAMFLELLETTVAIDELEEEKQEALLQASDEAAKYLQTFRAQIEPLVRSFGTPTPPTAGASPQ